MENNLTLGVLFGGPSPEYEISLESAAYVLTHLPFGVSPLPMGITKQGEWRVFRGDVARIRDGSWENGETYPLTLPLDRSGFFFSGEKTFSPDVLFPVTHGDFGEDGTLQGILEQTGVPFVGSRVEGACLSMNKAAAKLLCADVPSLPFLSFSREELFCPASCIARIEGAFPYPVFVKPNRGGSSLGASRAKNREELYPALYRALARCSTVLVEPFQKAREWEVGILQDGERLRVSLPGEITYSGVFYDFTCKYQNKDTQILCPAQGETEAMETARRYGETVFRLLGLRHLARVDFFYTEEGDLYFNEVNALPGFTSGSMYPQLMKTLGYSPEDWISALIRDALREKQ